MQNAFISTKYRPHSTLALFTFCLALVVILLGAYTRLTNAGLSCPDWPQCYGYITAPHTMEQIENASKLYPSVPVDSKKAWTEMVHRYGAGSEGILILALAFSLLFTRKAKSNKALFISLGLIALLVLQVSLGMLTVTEKLKPVIVLSHLLTGLSILSTLWWAYLDLYYRRELKNTLPTFNLSRLLWIGLVIVASQITLGGWVSTHYAALACVDFPYCNGAVIPAMHLSLFNSDLITIHMLHRIGAFITFIYIGSLAIILYGQPAFKFIGGLLLTLLSLQITLGVLNIIWLLPVPIALIHHGVAILILLTMITTLTKASILKGGLSEHLHS